MGKKKQYQTKCMHLLQEEFYFQSIKIWESSDLKEQKQRN